MSARTKNRTLTPAAAPNSLKFSAINGILLAAGLAAIILGYAVLVPLGIIR